MRNARDTMLTQQILGDKLLLAGKNVILVVSLNEN